MRWIRPKTSINFTWFQWHVAPKKMQCKVNFIRVLANLIFFKINSVWFEDIKSARVSWPLREEPAVFQVLLFADMCSISEISCLIWMKTCWLSSLHGITFTSVTTDLKCLVSLKCFLRDSPFPLCNRCYRK